MQLKLWRWLDSLPRSTKTALTVGFDLVALSVALWASYALRYGSWTPPSTLEQFALLVVAPVLAVVMLWLSGVYRTVLRYLSDRGLWHILQLLTVSVLCWVVIAFLTEMSGQRGVPRSVPLLYWALSLILVVGSRLLFRHFASGRVRQTLPVHPMLIYGAGDAGIQLAAAMTGHARSAVFGFLDDNPELQGRFISGAPVHAPAALDRLIAEHAIREVVLAIPSLSVERRKKIVSQISRRNLTIRTLPPLMDWVKGQLADSQVRDIDLDELLGRSEVPADPALLGRMIEGKNILVTGAGGSIGSELCRLIVKWSPASLILLEANEFALYQIARKLERSAVDIVPILGSITDADRVREAIVENAAQIVFHAAAHKHVPLLERNVLEGVRNNVFGTLTLARCAFEQGVESFVLISSDKAVRPTNVMGATKRWAELIVDRFFTQAQAAGKKQRFCSVRFGNVLGSMAQSCHYSASRS
ncbi:MAG: polysaccharide biosynthesis protein [Alphaproteobacteria bacterium]|nr:polysaccharide biosynthesis protein [Alphaproteobacteria bacterium]